MSMVRISGVNPNPAAYQLQSTGLTQAIPILAVDVSILPGLCQSKHETTAVTHIIFRRRILFYRHIIDFSRVNLLSY